MNCQDFEKIINEVARDRMMEATERARGLAHAEECQRCCARLRDERSLSGGLRSLALGDARLEAPARTEALLLHAFRDLNRATPVTTRNQPPVPVVTIAPVAARLAPHRWRWATGIAAAILLLFAAFAVTRLQTRREIQPAQLASVHDSEPMSVLWDSSAQGRQAAHNNSTLTSGGRSAVPSQFASLRAQGSRERRGTQSAGGNRSGVSTGTQPYANTLASASTGGDDIATDFIPLSYGASLSGTDGGHVVRVELPRTAMAQFGLPVNAERTGEPVKADVLMGEDGLARAIRFVR